jgi:SPX domain protein involved in polyphosphate accumulation
METKIDELEQEVEGYPKDHALDHRIKTRMEKQLDEIVDEIKELEKFSRINFTGFMKVRYFNECTDI